MLERARLTGAAASNQSQIDHLEVALSRNRQIGLALGILMASHRLTDDQAFELLRRVSQHRHRKIYGIALDIIDTGMIDLPPAVTVEATTHGSAE